MASTVTRAAPEPVSEVYESLLVPRMLQPWAEKLIEIAGLRPGERVLDVAAGTGIVAKLAARQVGPKGSVVGTDNSADMLDVARSALADPSAARIQYIECEAAPLDVPSARFDVVLCQQGLQFFPDRLAALREIRRALVPGGRTLISVWSAINDCPIFFALWQTLRDTIDADIADILTGPFRLSRKEDLNDLCKRAGMAEIFIETHSLQLVFEGGVEQAAGILQASSIARRIKDLPLADQDAISHAVTGCLDQLRDGRAVTAPMSAHIAVSRR